MNINTKNPQQNVRKLIPATYKHMKRITYHDEVRFIQEMQD